MQKEEDFGSKERLHKCEVQLKEKEKESEAMSQVWRKELGVIKEAKDLNEKIEITKMKAAKAQVSLSLSHTHTHFLSFSLFLSLSLSFSLSSDGIFLQREGNYQLAGELLYSEIPKLDKQLHDLRTISFFFFRILFRFLFFSQSSFFKYLLISLSKQLIKILRCLLELSRKSRLPKLSHARLVRLSSRR